MSIISGILLRPKSIAILGFSAFATILGVSSNNLNMHDESYDFLLRQVPETPPKKSKDGEDQHYGSTLMDEKHFEDAPLVTVSYKQLIYGDPNYNSGNYVIYYGSEACTHCTGFLFGDREISKGNLGMRRDRMSDGAGMKAFESTKLDKEIKDKNIKFLMYEDVPDKEQVDKDSDLGTLPGSRGESDDLKKGRVKGEYKRNDKSAKEFRRVFTAAQEKFGEKVAGTPTVILYKQGKPVIYNQSSLPGFINTSQGDQLSEVLEFKKFLKHYYLNIDFVEK